MAPAGDGGEDPPRGAEGEQETDLLHRRPEGPEERRRPLSGLHGQRLSFVPRFSIRGQQSKLCEINCETRIRDIDRGGGWWWKTGN